ncbi:hypothetical protein HDU98_003303 [Podochytrium sp. JEL0797]|nr:hypothetical protein HDU98_003303 [Podochytrium sp. JEL0797]
MTTAFQTLLHTRRSHRVTTPVSLLTDKQLEDLVKLAVNQAPSAFSSESSRAVLLLKKEHAKFWDMVRTNVAKSQTGEHLQKSLGNIANYSSGYGTVLIYEDDSVIAGFQQKFPPLHDSLTEWQKHGSGILQFTIWSLLAEAGMGASLQHQQRHVEEDAAKAYGIPSSWKLVAQIPFGGIPEGAALPDKVPAPIESRFKSFGKE